MIPRLWLKNFNRTIIIIIIIGQHPAIGIPTTHQRNERTVASGMGSTRVFRVAQSYRGAFHRCYKHVVPLLSLSPSLSLSLSLFLSLSARILFGPCCAACSKKITADTSFPVSRRMRLVARKRGQAALLRPFLGWDVRGGGTRGLDGEQKLARSFSNTWGKLCMKDVIVLLK